MELKTEYEFILPRRLYTSSVGRFPGVDLDGLDSPQKLSRQTSALITGA